MSRSKSWIPIYIGDFLADTTDLSTEEIGAYMLLIFHYWNKGPLTCDQQRLARICRLSPHKFKRSGENILRFFYKKDDKFFHKRLDEEIAKAIEISTKRAEAGQAGGKANAKALAGLKPPQPQPPYSVPKGTGSVAAQKKEFFYFTMDELKRQGVKEDSARALLGKLFKAVGDEEGVEALKSAVGKVDLAAYLSACTTRIQLPQDRDELWRIRNSIGLNYEFDDLQSCHAEIRQKLRGNAELRRVAGL